MRNQDSSFLRKNPVLSLVQKGRRRTKVDSADSPSLP